MAKIILSCGHEVDDFDHAHNIIIKATDRQGGKALSYMIVCGSCEDRYRQQSYIFDDESAADNWLMKVEW